MDALCGLSFYDLANLKLFGRVAYFSVWVNLWLSAGRKAQ